MNTLLQLLRYSLGIVPDFPVTLTSQQWEQLYRDACLQTVVGLTYKGVARLSREQSLPIDMTIMWDSDAEVIKSLNMAFNEESCAITRFFAEKGFRTVILKGQANARLYPDPSSRQPGDIDIWVEGTEEEIRTLLKENNMLGPEEKTFFHHIRLPLTKEGIEVEVHFRPSSCRNDKVQAYLIHELDKVTLCPEGFYVPTTEFALVMQLAHIRSHLLGRGVGLRQFIDYYYLLLSSTPQERRRVSEKLKSFGLHRAAEALMWVLHEVFLLDEEYMLIRPNHRSGRWMMEDVLKNGNFGMASPIRSFGSWRLFLHKRKKQYVRFYFSPDQRIELLRKELLYWVRLFTRIPQRIKYRTLSLQEHPEVWKNG